MKKRKVKIYCYTVSVVTAAGNSVSVKVFAKSEKEALKKAEEITGLEKGAIENIE